MPRSDVIKNAIKNSDNYSSDLDYLRLKIDFVNKWIIQYFYSIVKMLDTDNSNFAILSDFWVDITYTKCQLNLWYWLIASVSYFWVSVPIFIIVEYSNKTFLNAWWKIDYYGSFYRLKDIWFLDSYLFWDLISSCVITRIDYRIDFFNKSKDFVLSYEPFVVYKKSKVETHKTDWYINSWRIWNKNNRAVIVRGYDKKLDISVKWKFRLFWDYQDFQSVFRLEYEFWYKFCCQYSFSDLDKLVSKAKTRAWLSDEFKWKYLIAYEKIDLSDEFKRTRYCKVMSSYIKNALMNWINVYDFVGVELEKMWISEEEIVKIKNWGKIDILQFKN